MLWEQGLTLGDQAWLTTATGDPTVPQATVDEGTRPHPCQTSAAPPAPPYIARGGVCGCNCFGK